MSESQNTQDQVSTSSIQPIISEIPLSHQDEKGDDNIEMSIIEKNSILVEYHTACQMGDLQKVKDMIENNIIEINHDYDDKERVTGLHWAAVNNRISVVKYLISKGANVNFKGGDLEATPLHWASKSGYVHIVDWLLKSGANPVAVDIQGYNLLHTAIFSSNIMLILYVLFFVVDKGEIDIDVPDPTGKTALHWASYQCDLFTVNALLKFQANLKVTDDKGFTPLHWAAVKGHPSVMQSLIENGADIFQKNNDLKNVFVISQEMKTEYGLRSALSSCGFDKHGFPLPKFIKNPLYAKLITFFIPYLCLGIIFKSLASLHPIFSVIIIILTLSSTYYFLIKIIFPSFILRNQNIIFKTPLLSGIFSGSLFWVFYVWTTRIIPLTIEDRPFINFLMGAMIVTVTFIFSKLLLSDPGIIPVETNHQTVCDTIQELNKLGKYDIKHFCIRSWIRIPLRSKYSSEHNALIARFDHYCPWIYNHVGLKNHKLFLFFIIFLEIGICLFVKLSMKYFDELGDYFKQDVKCILLNDDLCHGFNFDPMTFIILFWACFQSFWVIILLFVQLFQTSKGITYYEFTQLNRKRRNPSQANEYFNSTPVELIDELDISISTFDNPPNQKRYFSSLLHMVGLDRLIIIMRSTLGLNTDTSLMTNLQSYHIPTNYGWKTNLKDFWLTADLTAPIWQRFCFSNRSSKALLNGQEIDYFKLYKLPDSCVTREVIV